MFKKSAQIQQPRNGDRRSGAPQGAGQRAGRRPGPADVSAPAWPPAACPLWAAAALRLLPRLPRLCPRLQGVARLSVRSLDRRSLRPYTSSLPVPPLWVTAADCLPRRSVPAARRRSPRLRPVAGRRPRRLQLARRRPLQLTGRLPRAHAALVLHVCFSGKGSRVP